MDLFEDWSKRIRDADEQAYAEVFEALHTPLLRYTIKLIDNEPAAYDVVQDAFIKLWTTRDRLDPDRSLKAFLFTIVRNLSFNYQRQLKAQQARITAMPTQETTSVPAPEETMDAEALGDRLRGWIAELPPRRREAFHLSRYEGLTHEEIADVMDLTPRTVTNHIMLALQHLRGRLNAYQANGA